MPRTYQIGQLARAGEVPAETIRYYERKGLLPPPRRSGGNFRLYDETHRERLVFIRQCRLLDMTLEEIHRLLVLRDHPTSPCDEVNALLDAHIGHVSERIAELGRLKRDLQALRRRCQSTRGTADCAILAGLSEGTATRASSRSTQGRRAHPR
jgi:Cd(II)/Pb(II)-responsive transcriptional regulator